MKLALRTLPATLLRNSVRVGGTASVHGDGACPICDHPFPALSHMCVGGTSTRRILAATG